MPNRSHIPKTISWEPVPRDEEYRVIADAGRRVPQCAPNGFIFLARLDAPKVRVRPSLVITPREFYRRMVEGGLRLYRPIPQKDRNCVVLGKDHAPSERRWGSRDRFSDS